MVHTAYFSLSGLEEVLAKLLINCRSLDLNRIVFMRTIDIICKKDSAQTDIVNIQGTGSAIKNVFRRYKVCLEAEGWYFETAVE